MRVNVISVLIAVALVAAFSASACDAIGNSDGSTIESDIETQDEVMSRAQTTVPSYTPDNFLARQAMNDWAERMDSPDKLWYVYMRARDGDLIGYHICKTPPLSYGISMTNPERLIERSSSSAGRAMTTVPAPGLDGVYYGAADPELYFCFDAETDALIKFRIGNSVIYDRPLENVAVSEFQFGDGDTDEGYTGEDGDT